MNDVPDTNKLDLREAIGRRYSADDLQVEEGWIKDYALATNDPNPRYLEGEIVAPPIFPVRLYRDVMFKAIGDPEIGLDMLRLVHGEQDMTWHGPIRPGDVVSLQAVIETVAQKSKGCVVAIRKLAIVEGETGFMMKPGDRTTLADRLARLLEDTELRDRLGANGRARVEQVFDGEILAGTLKDYWSELVSA